MKLSVPLATHKLSQAGFTQLISSSLDTIAQTKLVSTDPMVTSLLDRLKSNLPLLKSSIKQSRGSNITQEVNQAQHLRNADISALMTAIKSYRQTRQTEKLVAYQILFPLTQQYKDIKKGTMEDKLALVTSFLSKLDRDNEAQAIQTLGLAEFVTNLKDSQAKLYQLYLQRSQELTSKVSVDGQAIRKKMDRDYKLLYKHLQNKLDFNPDDDDLTIVQLLNDIRKDHADNIKRKKGKNKTETVTKTTSDDLVTAG